MKTAFKFLKTLLIDPVRGKWRWRCFCSGLR